MQSPMNQKSYFYLEKSKNKNIRFIKLAVIAAPIAAVITVLTTVKFVYLDSLTAISQKIARSDDFDKALILSQKQLI